MPRSLKFTLKTNKHLLKTKNKKYGCIFHFCRWHRVLKQKRMYNSRILDYGIRLDSYVYAYIIYVYLSSSCVAMFERTMAIF